MIAIRISDIGILTNQLLKGNMFDHFLLQEAVIAKDITYTIDGAINEDYTDTAEETNDKFIPYEKVKSYCLELLKGSRKPGYFKFVFLLSSENQKKTVDRSGTAFRPEEIRGMYINLVYKNEILTCTTGISYQTFSLDKSLETEWDRLTKLFFRQYGIASEDL